MNMKSVASGWKTFYEEEWPYDLEDLAETLHSDRPAVQRLTNAGLTYFVALVAGASAMADELSGLVPVVEEAAEVTADILRDAESASFAELRIPAAINALQSVGLRVQDKAVEACQSWLPKVRAARSEDPVWPHWHLGLTGIGLGVREVYCPIAGYNVDGAIPFTPGETFELNLQGLIAHLAGAVEGGATESEVGPAWRKLLSTFPVLSKAGMLTPPGLFWIARIVHHDIGGNPLGEVADFLHDEVWTVAGL